MKNSIKSYLKTFSDSASELKSVRGIAFAAMFIAISIAFGYLTTIQIGNTIKIGFSFLPKDFGAFLMGPVIGGIVNGLVDIITFIMKPTGPFFPGFTFNAVLNGLIMGLVLYHRPVRLTRVLIARFLNSLIVNLIFNTLWLSMLYGDAFFALLPARAVKQLVMLPIETVMLYTIMKASEKSGIVRMFRGFTGRK